MGAFVLTEVDGRTQVSISLFESEEAFQRGVAATRPVILRHHIEELLEEPSTFRFFRVH